MASLNVSSPIPLHNNDNNKKNHSTNDRWFGEDDVLESARKLFQTHVAPRFSSSGLPFFACRNELAKSLGLELLDPNSIPTPLEDDSVLVEGIGVTLNSSSGEQDDNSQSLLPLFFFPFVFFFVLFSPFSYPSILSSLFLSIHPSMV